MHISKRLAFIVSALALITTSAVKFGEPISLFNGKDLSGWKTMGKDPSAWKVVDGTLSNEAVQEPGKHTSYANIRTEREFEDFNIQLEFRVPTNGNSGVYLRENHRFSPQRLAF